MPRPTVDSQIAAIVLSYCGSAMYTLHHVIGGVYETARENYRDDDAFVEGEDWSAENRDHYIGSGLEDLFAWHGGGRALLPATEKAIRAAMAEYMK